MSSPKPFEVTRWDSPNAPTQGLLTRWMEREGLQHETQEHAPGTHTPEVKYDSHAYRAVLAGHVQYSFPGYGVVELHAGDWLEIEPDTRHDLKVLGADTAIILGALK